MLMKQKSDGKSAPPREVEDAAGLEALPVGTPIIDGGDLHAVKTSSGAWLYDDGQYWEPEMFPCKVVG